LSECPTHAAGRACIVSAIIGRLATVAAGQIPCPDVQRWGTTQTPTALRSESKATDPHANVTRGVHTMPLLSTLSLILLTFVSSPHSMPGHISPGRVWLDDRGQHIQAHGGAILKLGDTFYWFGEDRSKDNDPAKRYVGCYSSTDLVNWTFRNQVVAMTSPFVKAPENWWTLERPKVFHNKRTGKFVMYVHIEGGELPHYHRGELAVFTCDTVDGDYQFVRHFRPKGLESRDIGQFVDDDGTAYLIFESRPTKGFYIAKLNEDYSDIGELTCFIKSPLEGGALVKFDGLYYLIGSWMTGWSPNNNMYSTATSLAGPWTEFKDIAPPQTKTYGSQSTHLLKVVGTETTTVVFMGDIWNPKAHWDSRYLWMPVRIGDGELTLPEPRPWTIDVKTGVVRTSPTK
jgi:hypothetical protein